jgi:hypothetical protein
LDEGTFPPLFGILQRVIKVFMNFVRKRKKLILKNLKVSMVSGGPKKRPLHPTVSLPCI